ncbi:hypothetical protein FFLO_01429 [Filobasidium floriforme]|uniref:Protein ARV n=1 Tax=Filobasidium floriforme TaxID=5210 RepID=A0A8K0JPZ0_9TREE|nr:hypothetical protein FFLO_01429 [Filobasidium floriforme]
MPICVHCDYPAQAVYTVYQSVRNTRLELCARCSRFTDPLIEHPLVLILLDLVLLKPRVFRHLVFNRNAPPRRAGAGKERDTEGRRVSRGGEKEVDRSRIIWQTILRLGLIVTLVESLVLYRQTYPSAIPGGRNDEDGSPVFIGDVWLEELGKLLTVGMVTLVGNIGQHLTTTWISYMFLRRIGWLPQRSGHTSGGKPNEIAGKKTGSAGGTLGWGKDGRRRDFRVPMISLTLLYASVLPLCLHLVLLVWPPIIASHPDSFLYIPRSLPLPTWLEPLATTMQREKIDEMWISTHLLSGMSSGLALRVLLPTRPWATMVAVLGGWIVKAGVHAGLTMSVS